MDKLRSHPYRETYQACFNFQIRNAAWRLEPFLDTLHIPIPRGIYHCHKFDRILLPERGYYVDTGEKALLFVSGEEMMTNFNYFKDHARLISDENGETVANGGVFLSLMPQLPVRAYRLLKEAITNQITFSRAYVDNHYRSVYDGLYFYLQDHVRDILSTLPNSEREDRLNQWIDEIDLSVSGLYSDVSSRISNMPWEELSLETMDDLFIVFSYGDYRINHYMRKYQHYK